MPNTPPTLVAGGTIRTSRFVKLSPSADNQGLEADANEEAIGVSYEGSNYPPLSDLVSTDNAATEGQEFRLYGPGDICTLIVGDVVTRGQKLKSDADARGVPIATTGATLQHYGGFALESASAANEKIRFLVHPGSVYPALS